MADQRQPIANTAEDRNQARRERDRARRNSLTTEQREEINARRRAGSNNENDRARRNSLTAEQREEINACRRAGRNNLTRRENRARRNSLTAEQREEINARRRAAPRRTSMRTITEEERAALLARRRENTAARRNTPCAQSIAMPCPNVRNLSTMNLTSRKHASPARDGTASSPSTASTSTPEYTIRTDGNTAIFTPYIFLH